jgi:hypothetical protein
MMKLMLRCHFLCYEHVVGSLVMFDNLNSYLFISFVSTFVLPLMNGWNHEKFICSGYIDEGKGASRKNWIGT